jgi:zinc transporter 7
MVSSTAVAAALLSTGLISLAPNLILLAFPRYTAGSGVHSHLLQLGQALAAGALLGDVFLHVLPHASATDPNVGAWILVGFSVFFAADLLIRSLEQQQYEPHHQSHSHHHGKADSKSNPLSKKESSHQIPDENDDDSSLSTTDIKVSTVLLNLAADALHNFSDGLAIGASFATLQQLNPQHQSGGTTNATSTVADSVLSMASLWASRGGLATLSVLFHEIPHELGDFCTLVKAGYSHKQAVAAQFLTAIAAFVGTVLALYLTSKNENNMDSWLGGENLVHLTAGGFIYLAATNILPDVLDERVSPSFRLAQLMAFGTGIAFLYMVALLEDHNHDHQHGSGHTHEKHVHYQHGSPFPMEDYYHPHPTLDAHHHHFQVSDFHKLHQHHHAHSEL